MSATKRLICLANSRKLSGRCVAGIEIESEVAIRWVRPVSDREHEEVSEEERHYEDGSDPKVMDIVDVPLLEPRARNYQKENWLLDPNLYWVKHDRATWDDLARVSRSNDPLWINGHNTYQGQNDRVPLEDALSLSSSLRLIDVSEMTVRVFAPGAPFGNPKRRVQGTFRFMGDYYSLWITDPAYERKYLQKPDDSYQIGDSFLTVSLGEPSKGFCYKLIAAIIERKEIAH